jgi:hypothetical protein
VLLDELNALAADLGVAPLRMREEK